MDVAKLQSLNIQSRFSLRDSQLTLTHFLSFCLFVCLFVCLFTYWFTVFLLKTQDDDIDWWSKFYTSIGDMEKAGEYLNKGYDKVVASILFYNKTLHTRAFYVGGLMCGYILFLGVVKLG